MNLIFWFIVFLFFLLSLLGSFIPVIPDIIPLWIGIAFYHFLLADQFLPTIFYVILVLITVLLLVADFMANAYFVKKSGGSTLSIVGAFLGLLLGMIFLGPLGIIIGPFSGVLIIEYINNRDKEKSFRIAFSTIIAYLGSSFIKIVLQIFIIIWFIFLVV